MLSNSQNLERISSFRGLRQITTLQLSHNPQLVSIDGFARTTTDSFATGNVYIYNNPRLCYVLNELSNREYWMVSRLQLQKDDNYYLYWWQLF